jgi:hypothetical protein
MESRVERLRLLFLCMAAIHSLRQYNRQFMTPFPGECLHVHMRQNGGGHSGGAAALRLDDVPRASLAQTVAMRLW